MGQVNSFANNVFNKTKVYEKALNKYLINNNLFCIRQLFDNLMKSVYLSYYRKIFFELFLRQVASLVHLSQLK